MSRRHCSSGSKGDSQIFPCEHPKGHCKPLHKLRLPVPTTQCQRRVHHYGLRRWGALQVTCSITLEVLFVVCFPAPGACIESPAKRNLVSLFGSPSNIIIIFSARGTAKGHRALQACRVLGCIGCACLLMLDCLLLQVTLGGRLHSWEMEGSTW